MLLSGKHAGRASIATVCGVAAVAALSSCSQPPGSDLSAKQQSAVAGAAASRLEEWTPLREGIGAEESTQVYCVASYLGSEQLSQANGRLYVWVLCKGKRGGQERGAVSEPVRLTVKSPAPLVFSDIEDLPDDADEAAVKRIFPRGLRSQAAGSGIDVPALERALTSKMSTG